VKVSETRDNSDKAKMASTSRNISSDKKTSTLLEALRDRESLWNTKSDSYKNRNVKRKHYDEILDILKEDSSDVDLQSVKGISILYLFLQICFRKPLKCSNQASKIA
jgi:hypothetical protein